MAQKTVERRNAAAPDPSTLLGKRGRVGGLGHEYEVVDLVDEKTAVVHIKSWDERKLYPVADIQLDLAGASSKERFAPLVGQYRSIGPDGPNYEVMSIESAKRAKIWIVANEENDDYDIEDILLDPIVRE